MQWERDIVCKARHNGRIIINIPSISNFIVWCVNICANDMPVTVDDDDDDDDEYDGRRDATPQRAAPRGDPRASGFGDVNDFPRDPVDDSDDGALDASQKHAVDADLNAITADLRKQVRP